MEEKEKKEEKTAFKNLKGGLKKVFGLSIDPNERETKILEIVQKAVQKEGTIITYTKMNDTVYLDNPKERFIIKIEDTCFTLVLKEVSKILLNVQMPSIIAHKLFAVVDAKIEENIARVEGSIEEESNRVLDDFNSFLNPLVEENHVGE